MRTLFTVVLVITSFSVAHAGDTGRELGALLKTALVTKGAGYMEEQLNRHERVQPVRMPANCHGRIIVQQADGGGFYDRGLLVRWTENALKAAGYDILSIQGRELYKVEVRENDSIYYNPATKVAPQQLDGTELYATVSVRQGDGRRTAVRVNDRGGVSVGVDKDAVWAAVNLQITDHGGHLLTSVDVEASDKSISGGVHAGWWNSMSYQTSAYPRRDMAVMAACIKAANEVSATMPATRTGRNFDRHTGQRLSPGYCHGCGAQVGLDWRFCEKCGVALGNSQPISDGIIRPTPDF